MQKIYCWVCDISKNTGEGNLAHIFLKNLGINNNIYISDLQKLNISNNFLFKILNYKYISPFVGLIFCWYFFLQKKKNLLYKLPTIMELYIIYFFTSTNNFGTYYRRSKF